MRRFFSISWMFAALGILLSCSWATPKLYLQIAPKSPSAKRVIQLKEWRSLQQMLTEFSPEKSLPTIHSVPYCSRLKGQEQSACMAGTKIGFSLYVGLSEHHRQLGKMPLDKFSRTVESLCQLRDRLWKNGSYGNLLLADVLNKIVYWRVAQRVSESAQADLPQVKMLLGRYRPLEKDWRAVTRAVEKETGVRFKISPALRDEKEAYVQASKQLDQSKAKTGKVEVGIDFITVPRAIYNTEPEVYIFTFFFNCLSNSKQEMLPIYFRLREQVGAFPTSKGAPVQLPGEKFRTYPAYEQFQKWIPQFLPDLVKKSEENEDNFNPRLLYDIFTQTKELDSAPNLTDLELIYP